MEQKRQDYIHALEEERRKIQVFQRELPLCFDLVNQALEACKQQFSGTSTEYNTNGGQSECSDQTSSDAPVFEEFIPIKRASSHSDGDEEHESSKKARNDQDGNNSKKSDWLRSVQLWNQTSDPSSKEGSPRKATVTEVKRDGTGGAFHPFKKDKAVNPSAVTSSTAEAGSDGNKKEEKDGQCHRKTRRCWSPELHRRFLQALQQLGGSHAATPKQIRELMKVDGLTNDEVKSHLQKYRLHARRPTSSIQTNDNNNSQTPQFVVVGGIWVSPEYAGMTTTTRSGEASGVATSNGVYAPIATLPKPFREVSSVSPKQRQHKTDDKENNSDDRGGRGVISHSPTTSSSTHTTTASVSLSY